MHFCFTLNVRFMNFKVLTNIPLVVCSYKITGVYNYILKTNKNVTDTSVVILTYSNVIYFVYISNGLPFVRERFNNKT